MENIAAVVVSWARNNGITTSFEPRMTSTNDRAREDNAADLYVCEHQTAGRGRGAHTWSDAGRGQLLASWNWRPKGTPQPMITPRLGLALYRAAVSTWPHPEWSLKAPNDLFLGGRKVAGLLIEAVTQGSNVRIIIGLGLNLNAKPELPTAGALADFLAPDFLAERGLRDFLSRWHLEMKLVCDAPGGELAPHDRAALSEALGKNPVSPRVVELREDGTLVYEDRSIKKWMEL